MEIRANYVLIGLFTLLGVLAGLGFFVWLAKLQIDRQYERYDVLFSSVSGLSTAAEVRFNGINVGQVTDIQLYDEDPSKVRVRIEVAAATPVKPDTRAQLESQGVTGVLVRRPLRRFGRAPEPARCDGRKRPDHPGAALDHRPDHEDAPHIRPKAVFIQELKAFLGRKTRAMSGDSLQPSPGSRKVETALADFSFISETVRTATTESGDFATKLTPLASSVQTRSSGLTARWSRPRARFPRSRPCSSRPTRDQQRSEHFPQRGDGILKDQAPTLGRDGTRAANSLEDAIDEIVGRGSSDDAELSVEGRPTPPRRGSSSSRRRSKASTQHRPTRAARSSRSRAASTSFDRPPRATAPGWRRTRMTLCTADQSLAAINRVVVEDVPGIATDLAMPRRPPAG